MRRKGPQGHDRPCSPGQRLSIVLGRRGLSGFCLSPGPGMESVARDGMTGDGALSGYNSVDAAPDPVDASAISRCWEIFVKGPSARLPSLGRIRLSVQQSNNPTIQQWNNGLVSRSDDGHEAVLLPHRPPMSSVSFSGNVETRWQGR